MPTQTLRVAFLQDLYYPDGLNTSYLNQYEINAIRVSGAVEENVEADLTTLIDIVATVLLKSTSDATSDFFADVTRRSLIGFKDQECYSSWEGEFLADFILTPEAIDGTCTVSPDVATWIIVGIKKIAVDLLGETECELLVNLIASLFVDTVDIAECRVDAAANIPLSLEDIAGLSYCTCTLFVKRQFDIRFSASSTAQRYVDFLRTRSISGEWEVLGDLTWNYNYLFLIRRPTYTIPATLTCALEKVFMMKEGNPAVRVEPLEWYKKRLAGGDIVILENPWI